MRHMLGQSGRQRGYRFRVEGDGGCMIDRQAVTADQHYRFYPVTCREAADHVRKACRSVHSATREKR